MRPRALGSRFQAEADTGLSIPNSRDWPIAVARRFTQNENKAICPQCNAAQAMRRCREYLERSRDNLVLRALRSVGLAERVLGGNWPLAPSLGLAPLTLPLEICCCRGGSAPVTEMLS